MHAHADMRLGCRQASSATLDNVQQKTCMHRERKKMMMVLYLERVSDVDEEASRVGWHGGPPSVPELDLEARGAVGPEHGDDLRVRVLPEPGHAAVPRRQYRAGRVVVHPKHLVAAFPANHHPPQHVAVHQSQPLRHQLQHAPAHLTHRRRVLLQCHPECGRQGGGVGAHGEEEVLEPPDVAVPPDALAAVPEGARGARHVELVLPRKREERHGAGLQILGEARGHAVVGRPEEPDAAASVHHGGRRARRRQVDGRDGGGLHRIGLGA
ncbi:hypothetical protein PR202_gb02104 [Eleusine coracana subsp. coracana]|uniref:Uncharacterized protein n=1 Tax=Eleusine coracana subsp. coracana TaxID=191504 RepID=A0AAV5DY32_ELECO|nr:hypothetical protein PR202_gb02104 [Eleusine coracana subsp. coracana]